MNKSKAASDSATLSTQKFKHLTDDELSIFLFEKLKIKESDTIGIDYTNGRYDLREVELKAGVDISAFLTGNTPIKYLEHDIGANVVRAHARFPCDGRRSGHYTWHYWCERSACTRTVSVRGQT